MGAPIIVPFNFQPVSTTVRTAGYTLPSGRYAYVTAFCDTGQTFSINGVVALQGNASTAESGTGGIVSNINQTVTNSTNNYSYTVPAGFKAKILAVGASSGTSFSKRLFLNADSITVANGGYFLRTGDASNDTSNNGNGNATNWTEASMRRVIEPDFFGPGNVITLVSGSTSSAQKRIMGYSERPNSLNAGQTGVPVTASFWCNPDTIFAVSGARYTVSEYQQIS
jgi:hypothetical protein